MKIKILLVALMLVLMMSATVLAQKNNSEVKGVFNEGADKAVGLIKADSLSGDVLDEADLRINQSRVRVQMQSEVRGLENAMINVDNEFALGAIQGAMERFQEREMYKYESYEVVEVNGSLIVKAHREQKFLLFIDLKFDDVYELDSEGEVLRERRSFWSYLFDREKLVEDN